ncbi:hypothetical protein [Burkholderia vietnamiensis]|uniref:hypothetical protein n=1 Tax=Burkholderia vietnamiensis TaxID=60552 RepID=UPI0012D8DD90|nr:hypothetical protein [Burkholderia vietnamiensis]
MTTLYLEACRRVDDFHVAVALTAAGQNDIAVRGDAFHDLADVERAIGIKSDDHEVAIHDPCGNTIRKVDEQVCNTHTLPGKGRQAVVVRLPKHLPVTLAKPTDRVVCGNQKGDAAIFLD